MWTTAGAVIAALAALGALVRSRATGARLYDAAGYGMTPRSHRRFAALSAAFALAFVAAAFAPPLVGFALLAVYALALVLYASSFARGFSGE